MSCMDIVLMTACIDVFRTGPIKFLFCELLLIGSSLALEFKCRKLAIKQPDTKATKACIHARPFKGDACHGKPNNHSHFNELS